MTSFSELRLFSFATLIALSCFLPAYTSAAAQDLAMDVAGFVAASAVVPDVHLSNMDRLAYSMQPSAAARVPNGACPAWTATTSLITARVTTGMAKLATEESNHNGDINELMRQYLAPPAAACVPTGTVEARNDAVDRQPMQIAMAYSMLFQAARGGADSGANTALSRMLDDLVNRSDSITSRGIREQQHTMLSSMREHLRERLLAGRTGSRRQDVNDVTNWLHKHAGPVADRAKKTDWKAIWSAATGATKHIRATVNAFNRTSRFLVFVATVRMIVVSDDLLSRHSDCLVAVGLPRVCGGKSDATGDELLNLEGDFISSPGADVAKKRHHTKVSTRPHPLAAALGAAATCCIVVVIAVVVMRAIQKRRLDGRSAAANPFSRLPTRAAAGDDVAVSDEDADLAPHPSVTGGTDHPDVAVPSVRVVAIPIAAPSAQRDPAQDDDV